MAGSKVLNLKLTRVYFCSMKLKPRVNTDSIKCTLKELFIIQFVLLRDDTRPRSNFDEGNGIYILTDVLPYCQKFEDSSNNKRNALLLNPLIRVCTSRAFTILRCINRRFNHWKFRIRTCEQGSRVQGFADVASSLKTKLLFFARLWSVCRRLCATECHVRALDCSRRLWR